MVVFYSVMAVLIVGCLAPSGLYWILYGATGIETCARRAKVFWNFSRLFAMLGVNILIWGHVFVGLWRIWFY